MSARQAPAEPTADRPLIAVVDYGIGNLASACKALLHEGADARLTDDPGLVRDAAAVVLPGVGAFGACVDALRRTGLEQETIAAAAGGRPFLAICVGMQMLFEKSEEDPRAAGLGIIPGRIRRIPGGVKHPQMQWNVLHLRTPGDPMLAGLGEHPWMYFVHSYHGVPDEPGDTVATCDYGSELGAAFRRGNVFATQFHPEKSAGGGLRLLRNFVAVAGEAHR